MTDRETIREVVQGKHNETGLVLDEPSSPQCPAHAYAEGQDELCADILFFIDSLPPPAADERLVELARIVEAEKAECLDCGDFNLGSRVTCDRILARIAELRGETNARDRASDVQPQGD